MTIRLLVCGPRNMLDYWVVVEVLDGYHKATPIGCLIEGGALGADRFAREWAKRRNIPNDPCPVDTAIDGPWPGAGTRRNARMLREKHPTHAIAFIADPPTRGTFNMVSLIHLHNSVYPLDQIPLLEIHGVEIA